MADDIAVMVSKNATVPPAMCVSEHSIVKYLKLYKDACRDGFFETPTTCQVRRVPRRIYHDARLKQRRVKY